MSAELDGAPAPPAASEPPALPPAQPTRSKRLLREYLEAAALALAVALAVRAFAAESFRVPTASMAPTLLAGDHVLASKLAYGLRAPFAGAWLARWGNVRRGDVIVFEHPERPGELHVKRVLGVPGDVVELRGQVLHVNGVPQTREPAGSFEYEERSRATGAWWSESCALWKESLARDPAAREDAVPYGVLQCREAAAKEREGPFAEVRPGHFFVVGDNRDRSEDGRAGEGWQVPMDRVVGKAVLVLWSRGPDGARAGGARFRADRLFKPVG